MKTIRIGGGSGYAEDRVDHAVDMIENGNLDYICFDSLSENELSQVTNKKLLDPSLPGFDTYLERRMQRVLPAALKHGVKIIGNMGSTNPPAAAKWLARRAGELGYPDIKVAAVSGDWVLDYLRSSDAVTVEEGKPVRDFGDALITANAYVPSHSIVEALANGADIVVTGRVGDSALFLAALRHEFGWKADDWDRLAVGMMVGHQLECAGQLSGGFFSDPPYRVATDLHRLGFPIAEVDETGQVIFTKLEGSGGLVSVDTCKEQALYEVHDPANYIHADVVVDLSGIDFEQVGPDRVRMSGKISGRPAPERLKVSIGVREGYFTHSYAWYAGPGARARAEQARDMLYARFDYLGFKPDACKIFLMGIDGLYGNAPGVPRDFEPWEVGVRLAVRGKDPAELLEMVREATANLSTNGPAAVSCESSVPYVREVIGYYHALIPRDAVTTTIQYEVSK